MTELSGVSGQYYATIGFYSQEAAEKFCKAFLTWQQREFPKTHDLAMLVSLIATVDSSVKILADIPVLNPYGVETRYPGDLFDLTREDAVEAVQLAERAKEAILLTLKDKQSA